MKKIITLLLLFLYAASIAGIGVKAFYCCNKLKSVTATFLPDTKAECGKGNDQTGCCNTKYKYFKVKDNHKSAVAINAPLRPINDLLLYIPTQSAYNLAIRNMQVANRSNAPPIYYERPAYIVNCIYRI